MEQRIIEYNWHNENCRDLVLCGHPKESYLCSLWLSYSIEKDKLNVDTEEKM